MREKLELESCSKLHLECLASRIGQKADLSVRLSDLEEVGILYAVQAAQLTPRIAILK